MRVADAITDTVRLLGVQHVFGLMGRANMSLLLQLRRHGVDYIAARHESSALSMADGYARATGRLGVATVTLGPGVSNAITGLLEADRGATPLLLLAGDSPAGHGRYGQFLDQDQLFTGLDVAHYRITAPAQAAAQTLAAMRRAVTQRRPVVLTVPLDLQQVAAGDGPLTVEEAVEPAPVPACPAQVAQALTRLAGARKPVLVAGRGALAPGTGAALVALADRTGALLGTTLHADGLFAGHPFALGILGVHGSPRSFTMLADADLVMAFGTRLDRFNTCAGHLYPAVQEILHCDIETRPLPSAPVTVSLTGDAGATARALVAGLTDTDAVGYRTPEVAEALARPGGRPAPVDDGRYVSVEALLALLDQWLPPGRGVVQESGYACGDVVNQLPVFEPRARVSPVDYEAIGTGLATAVGAAVGRPGQITVAAVGDGAALMALGELETMVRYRLPILVLALNNSAYGAEARELEMRGLPIDDALFAPTDLAAVGRALGAQAINVRNLVDLAPVPRWIDEPTGPLVLDCALDPTRMADWFWAAIASPQGFLRRPRPEYRSRR